MGTYRLILTGVDIARRPACDPTTPEGPRPLDLLKLDVRIWGFVWIFRDFWGFLGIFVQIEYSFFRLAFSFVLISLTLPRKHSGFCVFCSFGVTLLREALVYF